MKSIIVILIPVLISSFSFQSDSRIVQIRTEYSIVESQFDSFDYKKVMLEETSELGELTGYYFEGELKKFEAYNYGAAGKQQAFFYPFSENLVFIFTKDYEYDMSWVIDPDIDPADVTLEVKDIFENRYYFHNNKMIRWIDNEGNFVQPGSKFNKAEKKMIERFEDYCKMLEELD